MSGKNLLRNSCLSLKGGRFLRFRPHTKNFQRYIVRKPLGTANVNNHVMHTPKNHPLSNEEIYFLMSFLANDCKFLTVIKTMLTMICYFYRAWNQVWVMSTILFPVFYFLFFLILPNINTFSTKYVSLLVSRFLFIVTSLSTCY